MAENVLQPAEVPIPLSLFGGLVTEMSPADLPEGISPDCQDITFFPGGIASRSGASGWLTGLLPVGTTVTYQKTFMTATCELKNLILTSDGSFFVQDSANPGVLTLLTKVTPGSYASSVSAFGKELVVFHDNFQGTDVPRIYDGVNFDRATQWGPGAPPTLTNTIIPSSTMAISASAPSVSITNITTTEYTKGFPNYYAALFITCADTSSLAVSLDVTISGNANALFNTTWTVTQILSSTSFLVSAYFTSPQNGAGGNFQSIGSVTATRSNNHVFVTTSTPHGLQVGFQVQISDLPDAVVGGTISSIVINNEINNGVATVTTSIPHGLVPDNQVSILGVTNTAIGGGIASISRSAQVVTVVTTTAHGINAGGVSVVIAGVTDNTYNGQFVVGTVPTTTSFTYSQVDSDSTSTGGTVSLVWPVSDSSLITNFFTVVDVPTPTTFTVQMFYTDGTWTGGTVTFSWNGTFYVTAVTSPTSFVYQQNGPNASTTTHGTVTPFGQVSSGVRQCVVLFETRSGYITAASTPVQIITNGGQYVTATNIPIGPPNVTKRILAFTGADGDNFFYLAVPSFVNGLTVSTSTVVMDNVTTSMLVDFGDPSLFTGIAIDVLGNNLFAMGVLGPCLGVSAYGSRSAWKGSHNFLSNFTNLGFDGGFANADMTIPLGWKVKQPGGILSTSGASTGFSWAITSTGGLQDGRISQSAFNDYYGVSIAQPSTQYSMDFRVASSNPSAGIVTFQFTSPTSGILATATLTYPFTLNAFQYITFDNALPAVIPSDTTFDVFINGFAVGTVIYIDDIEIFPTLVPILPSYKFSYINLPEQIDLITGILGATDDDTPIQCDFVYRDSFFFLTNFSLHETSDLEGSEPSGWRVRQISNNCGACGPRAVCSGENFSAWITMPVTLPPVGRGLYLYTGGSVYKISQEIQPDFDSVTISAQRSIWLTNDPINRRMIMGLPTNGATAPNTMRVADYREMDTAVEIATKSPIHISFTGKMICSDLSRKWARWTLPANCGDMVAIPGTGVQFSFGFGNGLAPIPYTPGATPNAYYLKPGTYTDQDYGQIVPYYTTYFFINHDMEMQMQVGTHRKLYKRYYIYINGIGQMTLTPFGDILTNPWPPTPSLPLSQNQLFDLGDGLNVIADRCAFKIGTSPIVGTDNGFVLSKFIVTLSQEPVAPLRFGAI